MRWILWLALAACSGDPADTGVDPGTDTDTGSDTDVGSDSDTNCASGTQLPAVWMVSSGDNRWSDAGTYGAVISPAPTVAGQVGEALASSETAAITPDEIDDLWPGTGEITLEMWLWLPDVERVDNLTVYSHRNCAFNCSGGVPGHIRMGIQGDEVIFAIDNSETQVRTEVRADLAAETWHHVAGVRRVQGTGQVVELYVDGVMAASESKDTVDVIADEDNEREPISINFVYASGGSNALGISDAQVDELGYHLTALPSDEIEALAQAPDGRCEHPETVQVACSDDFEWTDGDSQPPLAPTDGTPLSVGGEDYRDELTFQAGLSGMHRITATAADGTDLRIRHFTPTSVVEGVGMVEIPVDAGRIPFVVEPVDPMNRCISYTVTTGIAD